MGVFAEIPGTLRWPAASRLHRIASSVAGPRAVAALASLVFVSAAVGTESPPEIAFQSDRDGRDGIYIMAAAGGAPRHLALDAAAQDRRPVWSPDGTQLTFMSDRLGKWDIFVLNLLSGTIGALVDLDAVNVPYAWSPDGRWISFHASSGRSADEGLSSLVHVSSGQVLGIPWARANATPPVWSPDGQWVAFVSTRDGNDEIYVARADGSEARNLTRNEWSDREPAWSPDGTRIAFVSSRNGTDEEIYVTDVDGSNTGNLTNSPGLDESPSWSPDGHRIAFASQRDGNWEIYTMDVAGGAPTNLTRNPARDTVPVWRPVGSDATAVFRTAWGELKRLHPR